MKTDPCGRFFVLQPTATDRNREHLCGSAIDTRSVLWYTKIGIVYDVPGFYLIVGISVISLR